MVLKAFTGSSARKGNSQHRHGIQQAVLEQQVNILGIFLSIVHGNINSSCSIYYTGFWCEVIMDNKKKLNNILLVLFDTQKTMMVRARAGTGRRDWRLVQPAGASWQLVRHSRSHSNRATQTCKTFG